jgi:hypothetical protein
MKKIKSLSIGMLAVITLLAFTTTSWAGSAHQHRMEGLAWGIGAVILGKVILDNYRNSYPAAAPAPQPAVVENYAPTPTAVAGHWEIRREWIPPQYQNVWNPGHYNRRGDWVSGQWTQVQAAPGYWQEKQVWIPHY